MEAFIRKLKIVTLQGQVEVCRLRCAYLENSLAYAGTAERKEAIACCLDEVLMSSHAAQLMLTLLEREVREGRTSEGDAFGARGLSVKLD